MNTVLYFGSFNPFHIGHAAIAKYVAQLPWVNELCFVLSPHNPFKEKSSLADANLRWLDLQRVIKKLKNNSVPEFYTNSGTEFYATDIEFKLTPPLYTYNTLNELKKIFPNKTFHILMGVDNLAILKKWYRGEDILKNYNILVYPRKGYNTEQLCKEYGTTFIDAPLIDVSSTQIREMKSRGEDVSKLIY